MNLGGFGEFGERFAEKESFKPRVKEYRCGG